MTIRDIDPSSQAEIDLVAERMRDTLVEVEGYERGFPMYSMDWLRNRVRWRLQASGTSRYLTFRTAPAHDNFGRILDSDGTVLLCLHEWSAHEHPSLMSPDHQQPGNGVLLFFRVDDFDMALPRARALVARLEKGPHVNPNTGTAEFSLRDPDGYCIAISALSAA